MKKLVIAVVGVALLGAALILGFSNSGEASSSAQIAWDVEGTEIKTEMDFESIVTGGSIEVQAIHTFGTESGVPFDEYEICIEGAFAELCEDVPPNAININVGDGKASIDANLSCGQVKFRAVANSVKIQFREFEEDTATGEAFLEEGRVKRADLIGGTVCGFNLNAATDSDVSIEKIEFKEKF